MLIFHCHVWLPKGNHGAIVYFEMYPTPSQLHCILKDLMTLSEQHLARAPACPKSHRLAQRHIPGPRGMSIPCTEVQKSNFCFLQSWSSRGASSKRHLEGNIMPPGFRYLSRTDSTEGNLGHVKVIQPSQRSSLQECCDNTYHVLNPILNDVWWYQKRALWNGNKPSRIEVKNGIGSTTRWSSPLGYNRTNKRKLFMGAHPTIMGPEMGFTVPPILAAIPCENKMTELQGRLFLRTHLSNPFKKKTSPGWNQSDMFSKRRQ